MIRWEDDTGAAIIEYAFERDCWRLHVWKEVTWEPYERPPEPDVIIPMNERMVKSLMFSAANANVPESGPEYFVDEQVRYLRNLVETILPSALRAKEE